MFKRRIEKCVAQDAQHDQGTQDQDSGAQDAHAQEDAQDPRPRFTSSRYTRPRSTRSKSFVPTHYFAVMILIDLTLIQYLILKMVKDLIPNF
jgi:hypothetical protein